jgi:uncharacterized protein YjgD (DUF1641 family)
MSVTDLTHDSVLVDVLVERLDRLTEQVGVLTADAAERARQRAMVSELTGDVADISPDAMARLVELLGEAERKGYFTFAAAAAGVADRVVTNFDEHDIDRLGDNIVSILQTVRDITQPEMLTLLDRAVAAVRAEQAAVAAEPADAPSLWALVRQLRDPSVRRGIGRALHTLGAMSSETGPDATR